jgi:hypothetical protein
VGDLGADVDAARAAGMRSGLVPTPITRREEIAAAPEVAPTFADAVERLLRAPRPQTHELNPVGGPAPARRRPRRRLKVVA